MIHNILWQHCLIDGRQISLIVDKGDLKNIFSYAHNSSIYYKNLKQRKFILRFQLYRGSRNVSVTSIQSKRFKRFEEKERKNVIAQVTAETQDYNFAQQKKLKKSWSFLHRFNFGGESEWREDFVNRSMGQTSAYI